jgi:hypothetical protein
LRHQIKSFQVFLTTMMVYVGQYRLLSFLDMKQSIK